MTPKLLKTTRNVTIGLLVLGAGCGGPAAFAMQDQDGAARPDIVQKMFDCRAIRDDDDRLECYDRQVAVVAEAEGRQDLIIADRQQVREARRDSFGLPEAQLRSFGGRADAADDQQLDEVAAKIVSARAIGRGFWQLTLDDGATWEQIAGDKMKFPPKVGDEVEIRRAAMGSFLASVNGARVIRVRRVN